MNPKLKVIAATLLAGAIGASLTACSNDLPTDAAENRSPGAVQADVTIAAIPANDDFDNADPVSTLPFTDSDNTSEATIAPDDPLGYCGIDGYTVWYKFTPSEDISIYANTFGSDYNTVLLVLTGTRGDWTFIGCNDQGGVTFDAVAGETYYFMVGAGFGSPGGNLVFNVDVYVPLELDLTIDATGSVNASTGVATVRGTVTCSQRVFVEVSGGLRQRFGRVFVIGQFTPFFECDGVTPWEAETYSQSGLFVGGRADVSASAGAEDPATGEFVTSHASATVRLTGKGK